MTLIKATTTKKFKKHFKRYADKVERRDSAVIINRKHHPNVVMISAATYEAWREARHALTTPDDHAGVQRTIDELTNAESTTDDEQSSSGNDQPYLPQ